MGITGVVNEAAAIEWSVTALAVQRPASTCLCMDATKQNFPDLAAALGD
jgi:hypothetical protein